MRTSDHQSSSPYRYDAVIFDVGGTLIGFPKWEPFQDFLAQAGLPASEQDALALRQRLIGHAVAERDGVQGMGADEAPLDEWWRRVFTLTWPDRPDLAEEMFQWLRQDRFDRLFPDAVPALLALRELGLPMGVLSNFTRRLESQLETWGVRHFFDFVIVSSVVGMAKPDPRIFALAVAEAGFPPHKLLYVGDHIGDDIEGAWGAGLDAVLVDRRDGRVEALCPRIGSLQDLTIYVRKPELPAPIILLDMDGVVLDSLPTHLLTWQQALEPLGVRLAAEDLFPLEGTPTELTAKKLTALLLGEACSDRDARRLAATKRELFRELFQPKLIPGIAPLLQDLRGRGYRLGLVTGSARSVVDESLAPTGVTSLFEAIVTGDDVLRGKPDPEPYQLAARRLGVLPEDCLVVENSPQGIQSARDAGMDCVALATSLPAVRLVGASQVFADTRDLRAWIISSWRRGR